jgi:hypothetical protein
MTIQCILKSRFIYKTQLSEPSELFVCFAINWIYDEFDGIMFDPDYETHPNARDDQRMHSKIRWLLELNFRTRSKNSAKKCGSSKLLVRRRNRSTPNSLRSGGCSGSTAAADGEKLRSNHRSSSMNGMREKEASWSDRALERKLCEDRPIWSWAVSASPPQQLYNSSTFTKRLNIRAMSNTISWQWGRNSTECTKSEPRIRSDQESPPESAPRHHSQTWSIAEVDGKEECAVDQKADRDPIESGSRQWSHHKNSSQSNTSRRKLHWSKDWKKRNVETSIEVVGWAIRVNADPGKDQDLMRDRREESCTMANALR